MRTLMRMLLAVVCLMCTGCTRLSPGPIPPPPGSNTFLIRGYLDWYSTGIDQLNNELRSDKISAQVYREEQWGALADAIPRLVNQPVNLIGFSYGADDVILIARQLQKRHIRVNLLITIDPVTPAPVPANVNACVNFYQPNGLWDLFPWLRGVRLKPDPGATLQNRNVRADPSLNVPDTSHRTIAKNEKIHQSIRQLLQR